MKNSNSLTNYSILVLVLLVLILIYIHIPNPQIIMRGGSSSDIKNMISNDKLYSYTLGHPIIQWVILVVFIILLYFAYVSAERAFLWTGAPVLGVQGLVDIYTVSGPGFLKKFYQLTQDTLMLKNGVGGSEPLYPEDMESYKNNIVDFKTSMRSEIQILCNAAIKCNPCECPGVDKDKNFADKCKPDSSKKGGAQTNAMRKANADAAKKFMGFIPKCCCLTKHQKEGYSYVTDPDEGQDFTNTKLWEAEDKTSVNLKDNPYKKYKWIGGDSKLTSVKGDPNAKLHGCDVSGGALKDDKGKPTPIDKDIDALSTGDKDNPCTCPDGDPTLNYYNYNKDMTVVGEDGKLIITDQLKLKLKSNLFTTWANKDLNAKPTALTIGDTEKSYRIKVTGLDDPNIALKYNFLDSYYYTDDKKTKLKDGSLDSDNYILAAKIDSDKIIFDKDKWSGFTGKAAYMNGKGKFYYSLPGSSFSKPSLFQPSNDFAKSVQEQMKAIEDAKNAPTEGFFGGIYNYIFPVKK